MIKSFRGALETFKMITWCTAWLAKILRTSKLFQRFQNVSKKNVQRFNIENKCVSFSLNGILKMHLDTKEGEFLCEKRTNAICWITNMRPMNGICRKTE